VLVNVKETSYGSGYSDAELLEPEVLEPEVLEPEVLEPEVLEPEVLEPEVLEPEVLEPEVLEPEVLEPEVLEPEVLEPEVLEPEVLEPEVLELGQLKHCACGQPLEPTVYTTPQRQFVGTTSCGQELLELARAELLDPLELLELSTHVPVVLHIICPSTMPKLLLALLNVPSPPTTPVEV
jgi:hypothetical protein